MKCPNCEFEEKDILDRKEDEDSFTQINGNFTVDYSYEGGYRRGVREVSLYACPECKTVVLND